jgi:outer membrane protein assembly factor BamB
MNGVASDREVPVTWSQTENVTWRLALPDFSGSTPIIWGNNVFLNVAEGDSLYLWCVDKNKGTLIWKKLIAGGNYEINKQNMSSPSPVTDGTNVYAMTGVGC